LFAEEDGETLAYVCFGPIPCTLHSFDFYWLATHKKAQRKGIGKKLVFEMFKRIKQMGGKKVVLETSGRPQYEPTHKFYRACGFELEATLKDYYAEGDDCLMFSINV
jgi:ribosomal protein S18 acetylase RimI-like enzyme